MSQENTLIKSIPRTTSLDMESGIQENDEILVTSGTDPNDPVLTDPASSDPNDQEFTDPASSYAIPRK